MGDRWGYSGIDNGQHERLTDAELRSEVARRLRINAELDDRPPAEVDLLRDVARLLDRLNDERDEG